MPISQSLIKQQILTLIENVSQSNDPDAFAEQLSSIIVSSILSATVTLPSGSIVTLGSATTQTNQAPATGTLS